MSQLSSLVMRPRGMRLINTAHTVSLSASPLSLSSISSCLGPRGLHSSAAVASSGNNTTNNNTSSRSSSTTTTTNGNGSKLPAGGLKGNGVVGVRRENKNRWERRAPLAPQHVRTLTRKGITVLVQPSRMRIFTDVEYERAGAIISEDLSPASLIVGVKEIPIDAIIPERTYMCFSHTIKAQEGNMPMLDAMLNQRIRLIDYEKMVDETGKRVIGFGRFAGNAGMIDCLRGVGDRLLGLGYTNPFLGMGYADYYHSLAASKTAVQLVGNNVLISGVPKDVGPMIFAFTGKGNVTKGALEIFQELPHEFVDPSELPDVVRRGDRHVLYGVMIDRQHCAEAIDPKRAQMPFDKTHYDSHPEEYRGNFHERIAPYISVLVNGMYWDARFPRLITCEQMKELYLNKARLLAIADISADPYGSIEFMRTCTTIDRPFLVYDPIDDKETYDKEHRGVLLGSVDNLPAELPKEASIHFGSLLINHVKQLAYTDGSLPFEQQKDLSDTLRNAVITDKGSLTPNYKYIEGLRASKVQIRKSREKKVLLLGAGMVAAPLVAYLGRTSEVDVKLTIATESYAASKQLAARFPHATPAEINVTNADSLDRAVGEHDLVVSLIPAALHPHVARSCIRRGVNMVTTSYISPELESLHESAVAAGVTVLNEVGLDPGIDHLGALSTIASVVQRGGKIKSFESWCGGLPAPEASNNPLGYKFSWSVRGVLNAGLNPARWRENGEERSIARGELFRNPRPITLNPALALEGLPNRDSIQYEAIYGLWGADTVLRGTLRYKGFSEVMDAILSLGLMADVPDARLAPAADPLTWGQYMGLLLDTNNAETLVRSKLQHSPHALRGVLNLGLLSDAPVARAGTPIGALCEHLGQRLRYEPGEHDMILLTHRFGVEWLNGRKEVITSSLARTGTDQHTAMALTVGVPAAIAAELVLTGRVKEKGVIRPVAPELCEQLLARLAKQGISMTDTVEQV